MELSLQQIYDYLSCPLKYRFRYVNNLEVEEAKYVLFKKYIHKMVYFFYYAVMGGWIPTAKQMKDKWAALWKELQEQPDVTEFLLKERKPKVAQFKTKESDRYHLIGFEMVHHFYRQYKDNPGIPIAVDHEFRVPISGIKVIGKFELIRETIDNQTSNRFIEIVDFKTSTAEVDPFFVKNDLGLSIMSYAFRNLFQAREDRLTYSYLKSGQEIYTFRGENDFKRMATVIEGVADGVARQKFYPRQGVQCKTCPFKYACDRAIFD